MNNIQIPVNVWKLLCSAVSKDNFKNLQGINCDGENLIACDGHRIIIYKLPNSSPDFLKDKIFEPVIPKIGDKTGLINIESSNENYVYVKSGKFAVQSDFIIGKYIDWKCIIPKDYDIEKEPTVSKIKFNFGLIPSEWTGVLHFQNETSAVVITNMTHKSNQGQTEGLMMAVMPMKDL